MKYNNKKTKRVVGSEIYVFDSIAEAKEFDKLYSLLKAGKITELKTQPEFTLCNSYTLNTNKTKRGITVSGKIKYTPDFSYIEDGKNVIVEVKGFADTAYKLRKKIFLELAYREYGIDKFIEVLKNQSNIYYTDTIKYDKR